MRLTRRVPSHCSPTPLSIVWRAFSTASWWDRSILTGPYDPMDLDFLSHCGQCGLDNSEFSQCVNRDSTFSRSQRFDGTETCSLKIGAQSVYRVGHISLPVVGGFWHRPGPLFWHRNKDTITAVVLSAAYADTQRFQRDEFRRNGYRIHHHCRWRRDRNNHDRLQHRAKAQHHVFVRIDAAQIDRPTMRTPDEFRAMADQCISWSREVPNTNARDACFILARVWLKAAAQEEAVLSCLPIAATLECNEPPFADSLTERLKSSRAARPPR